MSAANPHIARRRGGFLESADGAYRKQSGASTEDIPAELTAETARCDTNRVESAGNKIEEAPTQFPSASCFLCRSGFVRFLPQFHLELDESHQ
jgi:hypothetical protein